MTNCGGAGTDVIGAGVGCVAMGSGITNTESQALAVSGNVHAQNVNIFGADARLAAPNATDADPAALLANVNKLRVVARAPSRNLCRHQGRDPHACAREGASVGLLAQQVQRVVPGAVGSGASLKLVDAAKLDLTADPRNRALPPVLEEVEAVLGIDVHALLAQQVGAIQALTARLEAVVEQNAAKDAQIAALAKRVAALESSA